MEREIKLKYIDEGGIVSLFPNSDNPIIIGDFSYSAQRMSGSPSISAIVMYPKCLDNIWTETVFAEFNGERFYLKGTPTSSKDNDDARYKHELQFVSERSILENIYFYDVVSTNGGDVPYVVNSTDVFFFGSIYDLAKRLNASLSYSGVSYRVVVDPFEGVAEEKMISFGKSTFISVLQESYNTFKIPYYFSGKTIHIGRGVSSSILDNVTFKYGAKNNLLSISKSNANAKIITRIAPEGSTENIPYYYPNETPLGDVDVVCDSTTMAIGYDKVIVSEKLGINNILKYTDLSYTNSNVMNNHKTDFVYEEVDIPNPPYKTKITKVSVSNYGSLPAGERRTVDFIPQTDSNVIGDKRKYLIIEVYNKTTENQLFVWTWNKNMGLSSLPRIEGKVFDVGENDVVEVRYRCEYDALLEVFSGDVSDAYAVNSISNKANWKVGEKSVKLNDYGLYIKSGYPVNGNTIKLLQGNYIHPSKCLMPPVYRENGGRSYPAVSNVYDMPYPSNGKYVFDNEYNKDNPKEHIETFPDIKPSIKGFINGSGDFIDEIVDVAFDDNDSNEYVKNGDKLVYKHPLFFVKLRRTDGDDEFNLFDCAMEGKSMTLNFTTGHCGGHKFEIAVNKNNHRENLVQVDKNGNLLRYKSGPFAGEVICGREDRPKEDAIPQKGEDGKPNQQDTRQGEVWIALRKDNKTNDGQMMPDSNNNLIPAPNRDKFVLTNIKLPKGYITAAEKRLREEAIQFMAENNAEKFNFSIEFSRIYLKEHPDIADSISENSRLRVEYDNVGHPYELYVSSFSYKVSKDSVLPEIKVELKDSISVVKNALQTAISDVKQNIILQLQGLDIIEISKNHFISKNEDDIAKGSIYFEKRQHMLEGSTFGTFEKNKSGANVDKDGNAEFESIKARSAIIAKEYAVNRIQVVNGNRMISEGDTIEKVEEIEGSNGTEFGLYLKKAWDGYFTAQREGNIVKGIVNNVGDGGDFYTSYMRVNYVNAFNNYIIVTMFNDEDVPSGRNYPPCELMNIVRVGNQIDKSKQSSIYVNSDEERIEFLADVTSPSLIEENYKIALGKLPDISEVKKFGLVGDYGLYAKTLLCQRIHQVDWNGDIVTNQINRGEWNKVDAEKKPYRYQYIKDEKQKNTTVLEEHTVYHSGCKWVCRKDKTKEEPRWATTDWVLQEGDPDYHLIFDSSNGWQFRMQSLDTVISARLMYANKDILKDVLSDEKNVITWKRKTNDEPSDIIWKPTYSSDDKSKIVVNKDTIGVGWGNKFREVSFVCTVYINSGDKEGQKIIDDKIDIKL